MQPAVPSLPRALDVQRFAAAREQEIRALQAALKAGEHGGKVGVAALPRQLRRRTRSHNPYKHSKRPNAEKKQRTEERAQGNGKNDGEAGIGPGPAVWENRRMRRKGGRLQEAAEQACAWDEAAVLSKGGGGSEQTAAKRLETHTWHAKRLAMTHRWGWLLPEGAAGRGLGSRSFAHQLRSGAVLHDASYWCPLRVAGALPALLGMLSSMLSPEDSAALASMAAAASADSRQQQEGAEGSYSNNRSAEAAGGCLGWELGVVLHHAGLHPQGAIGPVWLTCLPSSCADTGAAQQGGGGSPAVEAPAAGGGSPDSNDMGAGVMDVDMPAAASEVEGACHGAQEPQQDLPSQQLALCMWVHVAAAAEALQALRAVAAPTAATARVGEGAEAAPARQAGPAAKVAVSVLDLRRVEMRGGAADRTLASSLFASGQAAMLELQQDGKKCAAAAGGLSPESAGVKPGEGEGKGQLPGMVSRLQDGQALRLLLPDPRLAKPVAVGSEVASLLPEPPSSIPSGSPLLPSGYPHPLQEAAISSRRQQLRRSMLALGGEGEAALALGAGPGAGAFAGAGAGASLAEALEGVESGAAGGAGGESGRAAGAGLSGEGGPGEGAAYCPAVLVRHDPPDIHGVAGWSLLLPGGWVHPFWLSLAFAGAKPIGQREWRWAHTLQGRPFFPHDFPDTQAYSALMAELFNEQRQQAAKRPKGQFTPAAPYPPPWPTLGSTVPPGQPWQLAVPAAAGKRGRDKHMQAEAPGSSPGSSAAVGSLPGACFVARNEQAVAAALWQQGERRPSSSAAAQPSSSAARLAARPVLQGLAQGRLQWRPCQADSRTQPPQAPGRASGAESSCGEAQPSSAAGTGVGDTLPRCLLDVCVHVTKRGVAREGAQILGCTSSGVGAAPGEAGLSHPAAAEQPLELIGFVTSELPKGGPKPGGSLGACSAAALWQLRSVQHSAAQRDKGRMQAYVRNPNSSTLRPVSLLLLQETVEK